MRQRERLVELRRRFLLLQLGGAAGTQLAIGHRAPERCEALARLLGLGVPDVPSHAQRDTIGELGASRWVPAAP